MAALGYASLVVGFLLAIYATVAGVLASRAGGRYRRSGRRAIWAFASSLTLSLVSLVTLFIRNDFSVMYVYAHSASYQPLLYRISAVWAGNEGSLLLWAWLLALYAVLVELGPHALGEDVHDLIEAIMAATGAFFTGLVLFSANPFVLAPVNPGEGAGINPLLLNAAMIWHPLFQYLGYVGVTVPFAYAMAALIRGRSGDDWVRASRLWAVWSWFFLSAGMLLGALWAYQELNWGGFWGWDPVENAALIPWLFMTAYLHNAIIHDKKGMMRVWSPVLLTATFVLTIVGTWLTRTGVINSVHSMVNKGQVYPIGIFIATITGFAIVVIARSRPLLKDKTEMGSLLSKEGSFLLGNLLFTALGMAVLIGTLMPLLARLAGRGDMAVSQAYYQEVSAPLGLLIAVLIGICPLLAWRSFRWRTFLRTWLWPALAGITGCLATVFAVGLSRWTVGFAGGAVAAGVASLVREIVRASTARARSTGEALPVAFFRVVAKDRRRWGGYLVHAGVLLMIIGIVGAVGFQVVQKGVVVQVGGKFTVGEYTIMYQGLHEEQYGPVTRVYADVTVLRDGRDLGHLYPARMFFPGDQSTSEVAIRGSLLGDVYVVLDGWAENGSSGGFTVYVNPLVAWLWIGTYVLLAGGLLAAWPAAVSSIAVRVPAPVAVRGGSEAGVNG